MKSAISSIVEVILDKAEMLSSFDGWKTVNENPLREELVFDVTDNELVDDSLGIESFKVKFIYTDSSFRRPLFDFSQVVKLPSGKVKSATIGAWINSKELSSTIVKVYLRSCLTLLYKHKMKL